jgi:predicted ABC-type transport system involved in lysophospholipase L1 biosynthesis ATPase subunit
MTMLEMRGVWKSYGQGAAEVRALREIGLVVDPGAMVAVTRSSSTDRASARDSRSSGVDRTSPAGVRRRAGRAAPWPRRA